MKQKIRPEPFDRYCFDSLDNIGRLRKILAGGILDVPVLADSEPVLAMGPADGELAFCT